MAPSVAMMETESQTIFHTQYKSRAALNSSALDHELTNTNFRFADSIAKATPAPHPRLCACASSGGLQWACVRYEWA